MKKVKKVTVKTVKKVIKKSKPKIKLKIKKLTIKKESKKPIGIITHYFSEIKVAVIKLTSPLKLGDKIRIAGGKETDFKQKISSMEIDHEKVKIAKKGSDVGLKVNENVREGYKIFKA